MFNSQKNVFWQALIICIFIFGIGILLGFALENSRVGKIQSLYQESELALLDLRVENDLLSLPNVPCDKIVEENFLFADKIYEQSKLLDKYEQASKISDSIQLEHKKYDLLRASFWGNLIKAGQKCQIPNTIVYLYSYNTKDLSIKAKQSVFARVLGDVKQDQGDKLILLPLSGDNNLSSVSLLMSQYQITEKDLPIILINSNTKISNIETKEQIKQYLK